MCFIYKYTSANTYNLSYKSDYACLSIKGQILIYSLMDKHAYTVI